MEAKDIVAEEVARQAEFGMKPSWEDFVVAGKKAGIREVVELINQYPFKIWNSLCSFKEWKAKLKEGGIEEVI